MRAGGYGGVWEAGVCVRLAAAAGDCEGDAGEDGGGSAGEEAGHHGGEAGFGQVGSGVLSGVVEDGLAGEQANAREDDEEHQNAQG